MGICKLCEKLGELLEKQLIGEFVLPAGRGSVEAHNRYGQVPAGYMKLIGYSWKPAVYAKYNTWKPAVQKPAAALNQLCRSATLQITTYLH